MSTALIADDDVNAHVAGWVRDMQSVRRLAPKTVEAYTRDLGLFINFLSPHTGGPVSIAT